MITLKAILATASEGLRAERERLTDHKLILACAALVVPTELAHSDAAMRHPSYATLRGTVGNAAVLCWFIELNTFGDR